MKRVSILVLVSVVLILTAAIASPVGAQAEFTCNDGTGAVVTNGVEFHANVRPGQYTATVIGLNGFDPVLAVVDSSNGDHLCNDDAAAASGYAASLPTTGDVPSSNLNSQVVFTNNSNDFLDISLAVGGLNGTGGEFILLFQGMQVTNADGEGDPFSINASPNVVNSGVGVNAYVIHVDANFDPLLKIVDANNQVVQVSTGALQCDDAGNASTCWTAGNPVVSLEGFGLTDGTGSAVGDAFDPYLAIPADLLDPTLPYDQAFINYLVTGAMYEQGMSTGEYVFAIHTGIAGAGASGSTGNVIPQGQPGGPAVTPEPDNTGSTGSVSTVADATPIDCTVTGQQIEGDVNTFLNVECPANCTSGGVWGTNVYTDDSSICTAAIHAGVIPSSGGQLAVAIADGQDSYPGSTQNGITSASWGAWQRSIVPLPVITDSGNTGNTGTTGNTGSTGTTGNSGNIGSTQSIAYGDSGSAQVSSAAGDAYTFSASARDVVTIAVNSDDFDPLIIVTDSNGRELTRDDDSGPGFNALVSNLRIPSDGQYIIVVTSFSGALDVGAPYTIELTGG